MPRRLPHARFQCGHEGCQEYTHFEVMDGAHRISLFKRHGNGQYRCVRHSQPDEVLGPTNTRRSVDLTNVELNTGCYWDGSMGFCYGPGFKAFARDFPPGTILRVSAEVVFPDVSIASTEAKQ